MKVADSVNSVFTRTRKIKKPRLVAKDGKPLIANKLTTAKIRVNARNWFLLTLECRWRTMLAIFFAGYIVSWLLFAIIYYVITIIHIQTRAEDNLATCVANVDSFISALLYSLESQATIGYGYRYPTGRCPPATVTLVIQMVVGQLLQTVLGGLVIAKILRPKKRKQEIRFSKNALVGPLSDDDNRWAMTVRLADIQDQLFFAGSHVKLFYATCRTESGKRELLGFREMKIGYDPVLLLWPITIRHIIDQKSPFYNKTRPEIMNLDFELVMIVEGTDETTGATIQARTSFLPDEISWGRRFKNMVFLNEKRCKYEVDYELFDETEIIPGFIDVPVVDEYDEESVIKTHILI